MRLGLGDVVTRVLGDELEPPGLAEGVVQDRPDHLASPGGFPGPFQCSHEAEDLHLADLGELQMPDVRSDVVANQALLSVVRVGAALHADRVFQPADQVGVHRHGGRVRQLAEEVVALELPELLLDLLLGGPVNRLAVPRAVLFVTEADGRGPTPVGPREDRTLAPAASLAWHGQRPFPFATHFLMVLTSVSSSLVGL
jgi:hypothetical protein